MHLDILMSVRPCPSSKNRLGVETLEQNAGLNSSTSMSTALAPQLCKQKDLAIVTSLPIRMYMRSAILSNRMFVCEAKACSDLRIEIEGSTGASRLGRIRLYEAQPVPRGVV